MSIHYGIYEFCTISPTIHLQSWCNLQSPIELRGLKQCRSDLYPQTRKTLLR